MVPAIWHMYIAHIQTSLHTCHILFEPSLLLNLYVNLPFFKGRQCFFTLFASLGKNVIKGSTLKEFAPEEQILSFQKVDPIERETKMKMAELLPLKVYQIISNFIRSIYCLGKASVNMCTLHLL